MCYEKKEVANGVAATRGQALGSSEEDESRVDDTGHRTANMSVDMLQIPHQQQQPQASSIRWERYLPVRSLKVLLVENDDSTRQVVSALLRNCSYEVTSVSNGLQAWRMLEDENNHIDLVLTEVDMPILSGTSLLYKIMSHKTFKNIPVIMMSSHDSMNLVFKCLSKGAVDFLVKPIRKNELKNLWQHIWRRCHSSSGSGSESGTQTKKSVRIESNEESENDTSSSNEDNEHENGSTDPSIRDGSDDGSGTQSSWTKKAVDIDSTLQASASYDLPDAPDSTCAQVIDVKPGTYGNGWVHISEQKELEKLHEQLDDVEINKDLQAGACEAGDPGASKKKGKGHKLEKPENENLTGKSRERDAKPLAQVVERSYDETLNNPSANSQVKGKTSSSSPEALPSRKLTVTRPRDAVLRHSDQSAFSKYNTATSANKGPMGNVGSCSPNDSSVAKMTGSGSSSNPLNQQSNGSSGHNYITGSSGKCANTKPEAFRTFHSSAFHLVQTTRSIPSQSHKISPEKTDDARGNMSNMLDSTVLNCSVTGSASGSNHGSNNGNSGSGIAGNTENPNGESDNATDGSGNRRATQREAAIMKFRQKRKERCFEKRVRYHSRKKLAEQRPRVKGQFVRRSDSKSGNDCPNSGMAAEDSSHDSDR
ncbi:PREDICTED: two-component response regulator-like APRR3 [Tarenaya hassleriana]|uniref:two-component response regulator-like APRR3 n=1 Tax=Tarenaya hassleriana TaxID=28532 RepID=UPI00053C4D87|nr:PREDICTED: two-component response regulator-like APRR3 [Tarenaya hassleriana]